jgi:hypothetical protein
MEAKILGIERKGDANAVQEQCRVLIKDLEAKILEMDREGVNAFL